MQRERRSPSLVDDRCAERDTAERRIDAHLRNVRGWQLAAVAIAKCVHAKHDFGSRIGDRAAIRRTQQHEHRIEPKRRRSPQQSDARDVTIAQRAVARKPHAGLVGVSCKRCIGRVVDYGQRDLVLLEPRTSHRYCVVIGVDRDERTLHDCHRDPGPRIERKRRSGTGLHHAIHETCAIRGKQAQATGRRDP